MKLTKILRYRSEWSMVEKRPRLTWLANNVSVWLARTTRPICTKQRSVVRADKNGTLILQIVETISNGVEANNEDLVSSAHVDKATC
jgi:hypothetical protein